MLAPCVCTVALRGMSEASIKLLFALCSWFESLLSMQLTIPFFPNIQYTISLHAETCTATITATITENYPGKH